MTTFTDPTQMIPDKRLDEIADILVSGILRYRMKKAQQSEKTEKIHLDNGHQVSPNVTVLNDGKKGKQP